MSASVPPGLAILQSNLPEQLRQAFLAHVARNPLAPLEDEVVLVQSKGVGRWLELGMAEDSGDSPLEGGLGISAAFRSELPARFLWKAYRAVLGEDRLPEHSLFDADRLRWLVFGVLGDIVGRSEFEPLTRYLSVEHDSPYRRFQLAGEIASRFEAYQFYRADWLLDWEEGKDVVRLSGHTPAEVPDEQRWQPALWRALIGAAGPAGLQHRGRLHADFVAALEQPGKIFSDLPRRLSVFGITTLAEQSLRALAALSRHIQVVVFVHNPCRYYWGNLIEARDTYRRWSARHQTRGQMPDRALEETEIADWANPLLASWGKQGRDFIGLLDRMDRPDSYQHWFDDRIDLYEPHAGGPGASLLQQIQQGILDLEPLPEEGSRQRVALEDDSVRFVCAHSRQREVEILHDQLLEMFRSNEDLRSRDVVVMVPDIEVYAPHIEAVFGQFAKVDRKEKPDRRFIPYAIGDRGVRTESAFLRAVEFLLSIPSWRMTSGEVLDLLQVPAVRERFGLTESDLVLVERWLDGAGVRWGLDQQHRNELLETDDAFTENTWEFGLDRMMLGYAVGQRLESSNIVAYDEVTAGDARVAASLRELLSRLGNWRKKLLQPAKPESWGKRIRALLEAFLVNDIADDALDRYRLDQALDELLDSLEQAMVDQPLSLDIFAPSLMDELEKTRSGGRFLKGPVTFCTLMPMRSIPFRVVCLLGMNDGEYPRSRPPVDFDLMDSCPRPGDRSRREDDRYLFLEAVLSAREHLYVSWVGRNVRDNEKMPPSVLVGQLRDTIAAGWTLDGLIPDSADASAHDKQGDQLLAHLTVEHPLQPFSREYFRPGQSRLRTYRHEWSGIWRASQQRMNEPESDAEDKALPLVWPEDGRVRLHQLVAFLRSPVAAFVSQRLQTTLTKSLDIGGPVVDEPVELDGLEQWQLKDELLRLFMMDRSEEIELDVLEQQLRLMAGEGRLPVGPVGQRMVARLLGQARGIGRRYQKVLRELGPKIEKQAVQLDFDIRIGEVERQLTIEDWLPPMHGQLDGPLVWVDAATSKVGSNESPSWDKLVRYWPQHLAACAAGLTLTTRVLGEEKNGELTLPAVDPKRAHRWLEDLICCWLIGQTRALPAEPMTSCDFLKREFNASGQPDEQWLDGEMIKVKGIYEGSPFHEGRVKRDSALARFYPSFEDLRQRDPDDGFRVWSRRIYGDLTGLLLGGAPK